MTQNDKVLRHLRDYGKINPLCALHEYGIMRLGARIHELKKRGFVIESQMIKSNNRYGEPVRFAMYYLIEGNK